MPAPVLSLHVQWQKQLLPSWRPKWSGGTWRYQRYNTCITVSQNPHLLQPPSAWLYSQQAACHFLCLIGCPERPNLVMVVCEICCIHTVGLRHEIPDTYVCKNFSGGSLQPRCQNARWSALKSVDVCWCSTLFFSVPHASKLSWEADPSFTSKVWKAALQGKRHIFVASLVHFHPTAIGFTGSFSQKSCGRVHFRNMCSTYTSPYAWPCLMHPHALSKISEHDRTQADSGWQAFYG